MDIIAASYGPKGEIVLAVFMDAVQDRWFKVYGDRAYRHAVLKPEEGLHPSILTGVKARMSDNINSLAPALESWRGRRGR